MSLAEMLIKRIYKCTNEKCKGEILYEQKVKDKFRKRCPFCHKHSLIIKEVLSCFTIIDKTPKTLGTLGEKNFKELAKYSDMSEYQPKPKQWWRKNKKKIDYTILKNPAKYVEKGYT